MAAYYSSSLFSDDPSPFNTLPSLDNPAQSTLSKTMEFTDLTPKQRQRLEENQKRLQQRRRSRKGDVPSPETEQLYPPHLYNYVKIHDIPDARIETLSWYLAEEDLDMFVERARPYFNRYQASTSVPYINVSVFSPAKTMPLELIMLLSNASIEAFVMENRVLEFGIDQVTEIRKFSGSELLGFRESCKSIAGEDSDLEEGMIGLEVGYNQLRESVERMLDLAKSDTNFDGLRRSILVILLMIPETIRSEPLLELFRHVMYPTTLDGNVTAPMKITNWVLHHVRSFGHMSYVADKGVEQNWPEARKNREKLVQTTGLVSLHEDMKKQDFCKLRVAIKNHGTVVNPEKD